MTTNPAAELRRTVSTERLEKYRPPAGSDLEMMTNYFWNIALSQALYPGLAALEVALRNSIHNAMTAREQTEWWFYQAELLEPRQLGAFASARQWLYGQKKYRPTSGQIVAQLNFGFWTTILSKSYHDTLWAPDHTALVKTVFPHLPPMSNNRRFVHQRYNQLRLLRNRVFHYERIWDRPQLDAEHRDMIEAIGWISPTIRDGIEVIDQFHDVFSRRTDIEQELRVRHQTL